MRNRFIKLGLASTFLLTSCGQDDSERQDSSERWELDVNSNSEVGEVIGDMREDYRCVMDVTDIEGNAGVTEANELTYLNFHVWISLLAVLEEAPEECSCVVNKVSGEVYGRNYPVEVSYIFFEESGILNNGNIYSSDGILAPVIEGERNFYDVEASYPEISIDRVKINFSSIETDDIAEDIEIFNSYKIVLGETEDNCKFLSKDGFVNEFSRSVLIVLK